MFKAFFRLVCVLTFVSGCVKDADMTESLPEAVALEIGVRSPSVAGDEADLSSKLISDLNVWAYICDSQGKVLRQQPEAHAYVDLTSAGAASEAKAMVAFETKSRYHMVVAVSNYGTHIFNSEAQFYQLASSKSTGSSRTDNAAHWTIVDVLDADDEGKVKVDMKLYPEEGKVSLKMATSSDAMRMMIDHVILRSTNAPSEGTLLSAMTPQQIEGSGWEDAKWWFDGVVLKYAECSRTIASDVLIERSGTYVDAGSCLTYENQAGWTDLSSFREEGFSNVPQGEGYYLDVAYRYTTLPGTDLSSASSPDIVSVRKYIPLQPIRRGNHYVVKVMASLSEIVVSGMTEISEETPGEW